MRLIAETCVLAVLASSGCYSSWAYRGDGTIRRANDSLHAPIYVVDLPGIDLSEEADRTFSLAGLPPGGMQIWLVVGVRRLTPDELRDTRVMIEVSAGSEREPQRGGGVLGELADMEHGDRGRPGHSHLVTEATFYPIMERLDTNSREKYRLTIRVIPSAAKGRALPAHLRLWGPQPRAQ